MRFTSFLKFIPLLGGLAFAAPPTVQQSINDSLTGHGFAALTATAGTIVCANGTQGITTSGCSASGGDSALVKALIHDTVTAGTGNWSTKKITVNNLASLDTVSIGGGSALLYPDGHAVFSDGGLLIKPNGSIVNDSNISQFVSSANGGNFGHNTTIDTAIITGAAKFPFAGEFDNVVCVDDNGFGKECSSVGPGGDPVALASAIADPGSTDTLAATSFVYAYSSASSAATLLCPEYSSGTYGLWACFSIKANNAYYLSQVAGNSSTPPSSNWDTYSGATLSIASSKVIQKLFTLFGPNAP